MRVIAENKKAYFNYQILEKFEAGISLLGQEVKSLKTRGVNLAGSYVVIKDSEAFWIGAKIPPYQPKNAPPDYNPERSRKGLSPCIYKANATRPRLRVPPRDGAGNAL